jgi:hypothetical protein
VLYGGGIAAISGTAIASLVISLQSTNNPIQNITPGDSVQINSSNCDEIIELCNKKLSHIIVPRKINFSKNDLTVNEANYNPQFGNGDQIY